MQQKVPGHAAKRPFPQAAMAISTGDDDAGILLPGNSLKLSRIVADRPGHDWNGLDAMVLQPADNILDMGPGGVERLRRRDRGNGDMRRLPQQRHCIRHGATSLPGVLSGNDHAIQLQ